ncbi:MULTISPECIES: hypothetical protein [Exiguobacterium]|nr:MULTISPECIES: hypothetical protein [Exiguobacterium]MCT4775800.1 hypothetical protein [Exiguobacterium aquaticum]MCT4788901.1 hypothetical protein [Exiguobacterium mexicanum]
MNDKIQMFKCSMLMIIAISTGYIAWHLDELISALNGISFSLQALI